MIHPISFTFLAGKNYSKRVRDDDSQPGNVSQGLPAPGTAKASSTSISWAIAFLTSVVVISPAEILLLFVPLFLQLLLISSKTLADIPTGLFDRYHKRPAADTCPPPSTLFIGLVRN
ncbi:hypothetical protein CPB84DRAFT_1842472 [Gymnopilus junonius]|uniref:Uncharacterized protein n=1 Tax=Gymnopilus junonius TaxID=109634 RepID=A0A9P5TSD1_GYMJU|nr:hypothetical protein CPB84DRAFT_1842472 [Gymnopilus junonius]